MYLIYYPRNLFELYLYQLNFEIKQTIQFFGNCCELSLYNYYAKIDGLHIPR